jgi:hypothetical protein
MFCVARENMFDGGGGKEGRQERGVFIQRYYSKDVATYLNDDIFLVFVCWKRGASQGVQGATIVYIS